MYGRENNMDKELLQLVLKTQEYLNNLAHQLALQEEFKKAAEMRDLAQSLPEKVRTMKRYDAKDYLISIVWQGEDNDEEYVPLDESEDCNLR